ncbi:hypothetical protein AHF37_02562 [Paragonimus kellicotti]|nr:hypothetical protein AHF37_02562 [Paragonimus kellicotti]
MLDEFIQTQGQLDIREKENIDLKSSLSSNEQQVKELSQELLITKDRLGKTQKLLREAELIRSAAEQKIKEQTTECHIRIEQYQTELEKTTNQLMEERGRSDVLLVQLERACHRSSAYASQIKYSRAMNLLKRRTRSVLSNTGRHHQYLHRRLARMKRTQQQLIRRLTIRTGQLQRLDQLLWETGWKYTRIKDRLECLAKCKTDEMLQSMEVKQ